MAKRNLLQRTLRKFVPGIRKAEDETKRHGKDAVYFTEVADGIKELRSLKKRFLSGFGGKTPAEVNEITRKFNNKPDVKRLKNLINTYKTRQRTK